MPSHDQKLASLYHQYRPSSPPPSYSASAPNLLDGTGSRRESSSADPQRDNPNPPSHVSSRKPSATPSLESSPTPPSTAVSALHPQLAVILGVKERWHIPLQLCRALSMAPAIWWGARSNWFFLGNLLLFEYGTEGLRIGFPGPGPWDQTRRIEVTEMLLAVVWCTASAYLSFFFVDGLMSRWLLLYDAKATIIRLSTIGMLNIYTVSIWMQICRVEQVPARLLPAWICCAITLTVFYHLTQRNNNIKRETSATRRAFWLSMEITLVVLILQLHFPWDYFLPA